MSVAASRRPAADGRPPADRLLSAAERLFGEHGYRRTTVAGICSHAGMATGSFYAFVAYVYAGLVHFTGMRWAEWTGGGRVPDDVFEDLMALLAGGLSPAQVAPAAERAIVSSQ